MLDFDLVVFDLAGTLIDEGSNGPVDALVAAFKKYGYTVTPEEIRKDMGKRKREHIRALLTSERGGYTRGKENGIYAAFEEYLINNASKYSKPIESAVNVMKYIRELGPRVAITTGYPESIMNALLSSAAKDHGLFGYDAAVSASQVPKGRPYPHMIYKSMMDTDILDSRRVAKVGDTIPDIRAAVNAQVCPIGITATGNLGGMERGEAWELMTAAGARYAVKDLRGVASALIKGR